MCCNLSPIVGDFNIHIDDSLCKAGSNFLNLIDMNNLEQKVDRSTHKCGHILDLVITRPGEFIVSNVRYNNLIDSDHSVVLFDMNMVKPKPDKHSVRYRKWNKVDPAALQSDIEKNLVLNDDMTIFLSLRLYLCRSLFNFSLEAESFS